MCYFYKKSLKTFITSMLESAAVIFQSEGVFTLKT